MNKIHVTKNFVDKRITLEEAMEILQCSERTIYRYQDLYKTEWPPWFIHWLQGKPSNHNSNTSKHKDIDRIIRKNKYHDYWPTLLAERLEEEYHIQINKESLRQRMIKLGIWVAKKQNKKVKRQKRERKWWYGMMIQFDGSYHDWLEKGETKCLLLAVDDATSKIVDMEFADWEWLWDIYRFFKWYFEKHGKPEILYVDRHASYKVNHPNDQFDEEMKTRFQRAMGKLGIVVYYSKIPEGKGRVERWFRTLQDRLIKAMREKGIKEYEEANSFLKEYTEIYNKKFGVEAKEEWDNHIPLQEKERLELERMFATITERKLKRDWTIQYKNEIYQIVKNQRIYDYRLDVHESINNNIRIYSWTEKLIFKKIP